MATPTKQPIKTPTLPLEGKPEQDIQPEQQSSSAKDIFGPTDISAADIEQIKKLSLIERMTLIELNMPDIPKTGRNETKTGELRYNFREAEAVVNAIRPLLARYRVKVIPLMEDHKMINRSGYDERAAGEVSKGVKAVVKFTFKFINIDKDKDVLDIPWTAEGDDWGDKGTNKAATTAQKNMYMKVFNIADDDPDEETPERAGMVTPGKTISPDKVTIINTMLRRLKQSPTDFEAKLGKSIEKMTNAEGDDAISRMESVISRQLAEEAANA